MEEIRFDKRNYRRHSDRNKEVIRRSLMECGAGRSVVIDRDGELIAGNGVFEQAKKLGIKPKIVETDGSELVVVRRTDLGTDDEKRKRLAMADNAAGDAVDWDADLLRADFSVDELADFGIDLGVFEDRELELEAKEDDFDEEKEMVETVCKKGDIWQLGEHRLMCGDSTSAGDIARLMDGEKADMCFTDPPYGMKKECDGVLNDNLNYDDLLEFNKKWIPLTFANLKGNGSWYCWGTDEPLMDIYSDIIKPMMKENKITFRNLITWDKGSGQGQLWKGFRMYPVADEKCLFVMCGVEGFNNNTDNYFEGWEPIRLYFEGEAQNVGLTPAKLKEICGVGMYARWFTKSQWGLMTEGNYKKLQNYFKGQAFRKEYEAIKKEYEAIKKEYEAIKQKWYATRAYFDNAHDNMNDVWHFQRTSQEERKQTGGHSTPKPIALCSRAIKSSSRENETVLDVFGGSGSTLIACEQLGRKCYMMELDPHYCDVIIARWEKLTGKTASRL